jgi:hypothetical protein
MGMDSWCCTRPMQMQSEDGRRRAGAMAGRNTTMATGLTPGFRLILGRVRVIPPGSDPVGVVGPLLGRAW